MRVSLLQNAVRRPAFHSAHAVGGIDPVAVWDFAQGEFPQGFGHTRASVGIGIDAMGNFATIGANMLRYDRSKALPEVILEPGATNILSFGEARIGAGWTPSGASAVNLALDALGQFAGCRVASNGATWHRLLHSERPVLASGVPYRVTCWLALGSSDQAVIILRDNTGGTESRLQTTISAATVQSELAGQITDISTRVSLGVLELSCVFTPNFSRDVNFGIGPASSVAGQDVIIFGAQVTMGTARSTYVHSFGGAATRAADIVTWAAPSGEFDLRLTLGDGTHSDQTNISTSSSWAPELPLRASKLALYPVGTL